VREEFLRLVCEHNRACDEKGKIIDRVFSERVATHKKRVKASFAIFLCVRRVHQAVVIPPAVFSKLKDAKIPCALVVPTGAKLDAKTH